MKTNKGVALTLAAIILASGVGMGASAAVAAPSVTVSDVAGSTFAPTVATMANSSIATASAPVLTVSKIGTDRATLSWNKSVVTGNAIAYKLKVMQGTKTIKTTSFFGVPAYSKMITGLDAGKKYTATVEITVISKDGKKSVTVRSAAKAFTTTQIAASIVKVSTPTNLKTTPYKGSATLTWNKPAVTGKVTGYTIILKQGTTTLKAYSVNGSTTKLSVMSLKSNTAYSLHVKANASSADGKYKASSAYANVSFRTNK